MEWISVKDRLPEKNKDNSWARVLTINTHGFQETLYFDSEYKRFTTQPWQPDVTHWMPLPEPPKK